ncbi:MAG: sulfoxide reductase heme-binding subunit YedZ [Granulosicoccus sp.]|jgi:sulfoxide reductase heme-binding subunit YedZ
MSLHSGVLGAKLSSVRWQSALKPAVFVLALLPFLLLLQSLLTGQLGPNPIDSITDQTGTFAIRMLLISLSLTPLRWILKNTWPIRFRRMMGLFAFFYASLHVTTYLLLDQQFDVAAIWSDLSERPYIVAGTVAFLILLPLAVTSNRRMVKRLGTRWLSLHRWVYIAGTAAVVHYVWLAKGDLIEPIVYLLLLLVLFSYRLIKTLR